MNILFLGDIFGDDAIQKLKKHLPILKKKENIDFVIAQGENTSGRKGLVPNDYVQLKKAGIDAFVMGNHIWAKNEINSIIENDDIIRPYNVNLKYPGKGSKVFKVKGKTIRVTELIGKSFIPLGYGWDEQEADNFFDAMDKLETEKETDFHIVDFHAETTSEKNVFGLYCDGKVNAFVGTHTHVQTNDARTLPKGTAYITDVGMVGPTDSAIGASYETVYPRMRYDEKSKFEVSLNKIVMNGVIIKVSKTKNEIKTIKKVLR